MPTPEDGLQAPSAADATAAVRVAALSAQDGTWSIDRLLQEADGFAIQPATSVIELLEAVRAGRVDVVVLAIDRVEAWPVTVAENVAAQLSRQTPLIVVCEAAHDGELIEKRIGRTGAMVLIRASLTATLLADAIRVAIARLGGPRSRPS